MAGPKHIDSPQNLALPLGLPLSNPSKKPRYHLVMCYFSHNDCCRLFPRGKSHHGACQPRSLERILPPWVLRSNKKHWGLLD